MTTRLTIPSGDFHAYLFDCDGTVADSMPLHFLAWSQALGEWNCTFTEERFYAWGGMPIPEIVQRPISGTSSVECANPSSAVSQNRK